MVRFKPGFVSYQAETAFTEGSETSGESGGSSCRIENRALPSPTVYCTSAGSPEPSSRLSDKHGLLSEWWTA